MQRLTTRTTRCAAGILVTFFLIAANNSTADYRSGKGPLTLQIQGRAFTPAGPLVNATVTGFGDVTPATTVTNGTGDFMVSVNFAATSSLARLTVRGTGNQDHIEFISVPGPYSALATTAGDSTLDRSEDPYVDLTPHTTGVYLAMRAIDPLADAAGWQRARRSFAAQDSVQRAAILGGLADGLAPLPVGTATTLEAASQLAGAQATQDLLFNLNGVCLSAPVCSMEAQLLAPPLLPVLPATPLDLEYRAYGPFRNSIINAPAAVLLATGGTGTLLMANGGVGANFSLNQPLAIEWAPVGNVLRLHRSDDSPLASREAFVAPACGGGGQIRRVSDTLAIRLRYLAGPGGTVLLQAGEEVRNSFPDTPACITNTTTFDPTLYDRVVAANEVPLPLADPSGKLILLPVCETACADAPTHDGALLNEASEPHQFDLGGTGMQLRLGRSFTWSNTAGRLSLIYSNGHSAEFTQVSDERPGVGSVVARYIDSTAGQFVTNGTIVEKDPTASFGSDAASAAASFDTKINREYPYARIHAMQRSPFGFTFYADGTGTRLDNTGFIRWYLENGGNRIRHERFANSTSVNLQQRRLWELIRADDDQYLVLENSNATPPTPLTYTPTPRLFVYVRSGIAAVGSAPDAPAPLVAPGDSGDAAGTAVAIGGEFVVVGAPNATVGGIDAGEVYVFRKPPPALAAALAGKDGLATRSTTELELVATLAAPAPTIGDKWGTSVTISPDGSTIAIGAPGATDTGQVAVFEMPTGGWIDSQIPEVVLAPPVIGGVTVENFGAALAMTSEGSIAVGAPGTDIGAVADAGMASVYVPDGGGGFDAPQQITAIAAQAGAGFGTELAASDSLLAIGVPNQDSVDGNRDSGAVYTYTAATPGATFNASTTLAMPGVSSIGDKFGTGLGVIEGTLVVGAPGADTSRGPDTGSGWVSESTGGVVPTAPGTQLLPQGIEGDGSGASVALTDGVIVLGAPLATRSGLLASGSAFVFQRSGTTWSEEVEVSSARELLPTRPQAYQNFGSALALSQDLLVTGSPSRDLSNGTSTDQGEADAIVLDRIFGAGFE